MGKCPLGEDRGHAMPPHTPPKGVLIKAYIASSSFLSKAFLIPPLKCSMINSLPLGFYHIYICSNLHYYKWTYGHMYICIHLYITIYVHMEIYTLLHSYICSYIHNDKCPYVYMYIRALHHSFICRLLYSFICSSCPSIPLSPYTPLKSLLRAL